MARSVPIARPVQAYAIRLTMGSHPTSPYATPLVKRYVRYGASPRAAQALVLAGKSRRSTRGRAFVSIEDIRGVRRCRRSVIGCCSTSKGMPTRSAPTRLLKTLLRLYSNISSRLRLMALRFDNDSSGKLEYLHVVSRGARWPGRTGRTGSTPMRGRGLEFADHRPLRRGGRLSPYRLEG